MQKINKVHFYNRRNDQTKQKNSQFFFFVEKKKTFLCLLWEHIVQGRLHISVFNSSKMKCNEVMFIIKFTAAT